MHGVCRGTWLSLTTVPVTVPGPGAGSQAWGWTVTLGPLGQPRSHGIERTSSQTLPGSSSWLLFTSGQVQTQAPGLWNRLI